MRCKGGARARLEDGEYGPLAPDPNPNPNPNLEDGEYRPLERVEGEYAVVRVARLALGLGLGLGLRLGLGLGLGLGSGLGVGLGSGLGLGLGVGLGSPVSPQGKGIIHVQHWRDAPLGSRPSHACRTEPVP